MDRIEPRLRFQSQNLQFAAGQGGLRERPSWVVADSICRSKRRLNASTPLGNRQLYGSKPRAVNYPVAAATLEGCSGGDDVRFLPAAVPNSPCQTARQRHLTDRGRPFRLGVALLRTSCSGNRRGTRHMSVGIALSQLFLNHGTVGSLAGFESHFANFLAYSVGRGPVLGGSRRIHLPAHLLQRRIQVLVSGIGRR